MPSISPLSVTGTAAAARRRRQPVEGARALLLCLWLPALALASPPGAAAPIAAAASPLTPAPPRPGVPASPAAGLPPASGPTPPAGTLSPGGSEPAAAPLSEAAFARSIATARLENLDPLCRQLAAASDIPRLRLVRERLLTMHPAPQPLAVVLANADVLLSCQAPAGALTVLDRYGPAPGAEQLQWLSLQWRAAHAALDHQRSLLALERLAAERYGQLESLPLPIQRRPDGSLITRPALELMADHLEALGQGRSAGQLLLLSRQSDGAASIRLQQAIRLLADLPPQELDALLERALEQAAAAGAWSLVSELLSTQAALPASVGGSRRAIERQLRLTRRLDDAYGEWGLRRQDPGSAARSLELERKLRSPRAPGGHAADLPEAADLPAAAEAGGGAVRPAPSPPMVPAGPPLSPAAVPSPAPPQSSP